MRRGFGQLRGRGDARDVDSVAARAAIGKEREGLRAAGRTFAEFLSDFLDAEKTGIIKARKIPGGGGETWMHWQLALAYAKWISHAFHLEATAVSHGNACISYWDALGSVRSCRD